MMTNVKSTTADTGAADRQTIVYCRRCVISNQRPRITFNADGVCSACIHAEKKDRDIDWDARERELTALCDRHRSSDGSYDVVVPVSGGKDSATIAHKLKHQYGMHPLTATWSPNLWTDIGRRNHEQFVASGFDNVLGQPSGTVNRRLVRLAFEEMGDPFQPFIYGVKSFPIRVAIQHGIKLIMYAEDGELEYGGSTKNEGRGTIDLEQDMTRLYFSNYPPEYWLKFGLTPSEIHPYTMPDVDALRRSGLEYRHFSHYKKWTPQENYYYASEHCGFTANPERSEGTYSKYASLDDKVDGFHYYLMFIKFGIGRATSDAAHEIRDGHLVREEGVALVRRFDGEFPAKHFADFLAYTGLDETRFWEVVDTFRKPHVWRHDGQAWVLRSQVS
jgi:N-acetyl sugar amidotransferase